MPAPAAIGIDLGGTRLRAARVDASGEVLDWRVRPTAGDPGTIVAQMADLVALLDAPEVAAIGVGVPGRVDVRRGRVLSGGYVDLAGQPLTALAGRTGRPVFIDNDANMALVAEQAAGAARGRGSVVMFTVGTGIGGAIMMDGALLRGRAAAGQLGHIAIHPDGLPCACGRRGCIETTSSGTALGRLAAQAGLPAGISAEDLLAARRRGDPDATALLHLWAAPMRMAIDTAVACFDPEIVVLGGGLGAAMSQALLDFPCQSPWYRCETAPAMLGDRAGAIGAGLSALNNRLERVAG